MIKRFKQKNRRLGRDKRERTGINTGLLDCNKNIIYTGMIYKLKNSNYEGPVFWNINNNAYGIYSGLWYGDNPNDPLNYGKFIIIPSDNGMRLELIPSDKQMLLFN